MKYFKMLGYYFCELLSSFLNFVCSVFGTYPTLELGVMWLLYFEGRRVTKQTQQSTTARKKKEEEAQKLEFRAKEFDGQNI